MKPVQRIFDALEKHGSRVKPVGDGYEANCPAHSDEHPSLSVKEGNDGRVLLHCHAGCDTEEVVASLGLDMCDLFSENGATRRPPTTSGISVAELARHKQLPAKKLRKWGAEDLPNGGVRIRYLLRNGCEADRHRLRFALQAKDGSRWTAGEGPIVPYGLDRLAKARERGFLLLVEGESDCWSCWHHGFPALGIPGSQMARKLKPDYLSGINRVYLVQEPDSGGDAFFKGVRSVLSKWPGWDEEFFRIQPDGWEDVSDLHLRDQDDFCQILREAMQAAELVDLQDTPPGETATGNTRTSQKARLLQLALAFELFRSPLNEAFACMDPDGGTVVHRINSETFRDSLEKIYFERTGDVASETALNEVLRILRAKAIYEGETRDIHIRVGGDLESICVDLGGQPQRLVRINAEGWRVAETAPLHFVRPDGFIPLPEPRGQGDLVGLRRFLKVDNDQWAMLAAFLCMCLHPLGPYPILMRTGEQGSGKTTAARIIRSLIDPSAAPVRSLPRDERDIAITCSNNWLLVFDNVSRLSEPASNALCRIATGGGFSTRQLWTDRGEVLFNFRRPIVLTSIELVANRADLLDRSLFIELESVEDADRRDEQQLWADFEEARPALLSALYEAVHQAAQNLPEIRGKGLPRMADFARWSMAAAPAFGFSGEKWLEAYEEQRLHGDYLALEAEPWAAHLVRFAKRAVTWRGSCADLLQRLHNVAGDRLPIGSPSSARALSGALRRVSVNLRRIGVEVEFEKREPALRPVVITWKG